MKFIDNKVKRVLEKH